MPAIWAGIIAGVAGAGITAAGNASAQKSAAANRDKAFAGAQGTLDAIAGGEYGSLEDIFGSRLDPEAFLYEPVDITQSQLDTISGNIQAFPGALQLTQMVNPSIWQNDLARIRKLMPTYDDSRDLYLGTTKSLLAGQLPFQDVEDIVSNRSGISGMLGTPGGGRNATLRDLGMSRLTAQQQGASMFQQFIQMAEAISPVSAQLRPQQMMFSPQERLQSDILQRSLEQQGRASAAMAEAMPDPAAAGMANAQIGLSFAGLGSSYQPTAGMGMQALGQGISAFGGALGMMGGRQQQPAPLYGGGQPISNQSMVPQASYGGGGYSAQPVMPTVAPTGSYYQNGYAGGNNNYQGGGSFGNHSAALLPGMGQQSPWFSNMAAMGGSAYNQLAPWMYRNPQLFGFS